MPVLGYCGGGVVPGAAAGEEWCSELNGAVLETQVRTADGIWTDHGFLPFYSETGEERRGGWKSAETGAVRLWSVITNENDK